MLQASKDDLQNHASHQGSVVSELQSKNANLNLENETLRRKIDDLNQVKNLGRMFYLGHSLHIVFKWQWEQGNFVQLCWLCEKCLHTCFNKGIIVV